MINNKKHKDQSTYYLNSIISIYKGEFLISNSLSRLIANKHETPIRITKAYLVDEYGHNNLSELKWAKTKSKNLQNGSLFKFGPKTFGMLNENLQGKRLLLNLELDGKQKPVSITINLAKQLDIHRKNLVTSAESSKFLACMRQLYTKK